MAAKFASWGKQVSGSEYGIEMCCWLDCECPRRYENFNVWHKHGKTLLLEKEYTGGELNPFAGAAYIRVVIFY